MNRRQLLGGFVATPALGKIGGWHVPVATLTSELLVDNDVEMQIRLSAHLLDRSAEHWRQGWSGRAFETWGEWYLHATQERRLPGHLASMPGDMHYYEFRWGEAGWEDSILAGTFRREHIACVIRLWGDHEALLLELAEAFLTPSLPEPWELLWNDVQLEAFIPTTETFGKPIDRHDARHWF